MCIKGKVIAITGAGQGLGRAMALDLASNGAKLALLDVNPDTLKESLSLCIEQGAEAKAYTVNIADEGAVEEAFIQIQSDFGGLDGLVNNAGLIRDGLLIKVREGQETVKMSLQQWQSVIDVNLTGTFLCGREAAAIMATKGKGGAIINISSIAKAGNMGQSNYSATKAGVAAMVVTWAKELARHDIRVVGIAPGVVATEMTANMKPEALDRLKQAVPLKRLGAQEELAGTVRFLLENDYMNGRVIEIDGGLRL